MGVNGGPSYGGYGTGASAPPLQQQRAHAAAPGAAAATGDPSLDQADAVEAAAAAAAAAAASTTSIADWNDVNRWGLMTSTIANYRRIEQIGEGTYGQVYRAQCLRTGRPVALKKIRVHHGGYWGMPPTVIREIKILKALRHPHMVEMLEVVSSKGVEYLDEDDEREDERRKKRKQAEQQEKLAKDREQGQGGTTGDNSDSTTPAGKDSKSSASASAAARKTGGGGGGSDAIVKLNSSKMSSSAKKKSKDRIVDAREGYKGNLFIVLEYVSHDLTGLLDMAYKFTEVQIKSVFRQLLDVLDYMHSQKYIHRDIKSSNILIDSHFRVKLADFGLARCIAPPILENPSDEQGLTGGNRDLTNKVITLWYRPPEILLGESRYGCAVDVWSAGCILAELIVGRPLFTGKSEMEQLGLIFDMMGTPTDKNWEGFRDLKLIRTGEVSIDTPKGGKLRKKYGNKMKPTELNFLERMLELDPGKRITAKAALTSRYFLSEPRAPDDPADLGKIDLGDADDGSGNFHEFQTKKRRREAKLVAQKASENAKHMGLDDKDAYDAAYKEHMRKSAKEEADAKKALEAAEQKEAERKERKHREEQEARERAKAREADRGREEERKRDSSDRKRPREERSSKDRDRSDRDRSSKDRDASKSRSRRDDDDRRRRRERDRDDGRERSSRDRSHRERSSRDDGERDSKRHRSRDDKDGDRRRSHERDRRREDEGRGKGDGVERKLESSQSSSPVPAAVKQEPQNGGSSSALATSQASQPTPRDAVGNGAGTGEKHSPKSGSRDRGERSRSSRGEHRRSSRDRDDRHGREHRHHRDRPSNDRNQHRREEERRGQHGRGGDRPRDDLHRPFDSRRDDDRRPGGGRYGPSDGGAGQYGPSSGGDRGPPPPQGRREDRDRYRDGRRDDRHGRDHRDRRRR